MGIQDLAGAISEFFKADRADDQWFHQVRNSCWVRELTQQIRAKAPSKREHQGLHDALLLGWANRQRREFDEKAFALTTDRSLPTVSLPESTRRIAITHTALLQWAAPVLGRSEENFAVAFAELTRARLLPQSQLLDLNDFRVFRELHVSSGDLPAEDVVGCIRYLRKAAPELDPRDPRDIQELARHVSGYFADPGRKYVQEISRLERELTDAESQETAAVEAERSNFQEAAGEIDRLKDQLDVYLRETEARERLAADKFSDYKSAVERRETVRKARLRLVASWLFAFGVVVVVGVVAGLQSGTDSVFDKVSAAWPLMLGLGSVAWMAVTWVLVGPKRLKLLGIKLPFQR